MHVMQLGCPMVSHNNYYTVACSLFKRTHMSTLLWYSSLRKPASSLRKWAAPWSGPYWNMVCAESWS